MRSFSTMDLKLWPVNGGSYMKYEIPENQFDNDLYIKSRLKKASAEKRGALNTALCYLYNLDGPTNIQNDRYKLAEEYLDIAEDIVIRWLKTRTNGKLRKTYGKESLLAAKKSKYRCEKCGIADVRVLNLDHIDGKGSSKFQCLCANCHTIKSREKDWMRK